jgi:hypothetical protein
MSDRELLEEHVLRRALRLDAEEIPPRLDPAFIAAAARAPERGQHQVTVAVVVAFVGGWVWAEIFRGLLTGLLAATGFDLVHTVVDLATGVAVRVAPVVESATDPAVPIAILAVAVIALLAERGRAHAVASS